jgi:hypothetical protein
VSYPGDQLVVRYRIPWTTHFHPIGLNTVTVGVQDGAGNEREASLTVEVNSPEDRDDPRVAINMPC